MSLKSTPYMYHDEPRLQLHAYLKSLSGYRGAPLHVDLCFYVCNPKNTPALRARGLHTRERRSSVIRAAGDSLSRLFGSDVYATKFVANVPKIP